MTAAVEHIGAASLYFGDCRDLLPLMAADVCITDPPYSDATHKGARGTRGERAIVDFASVTADEFAALAKGICAVTRRWTVMTCDWRHAFGAEEAGLPVIRLGVWTKADPAPQFSGDRPGHGWEAVLILHPEGKKRWNGGGRPAVWHTQIVKNNGVHPTEKPLALVRQFVTQFSDEGETILGPFMGSGTTGVAAVQAGRMFHGIECDPRHFETACRRIEDAQRQGDMFVEKAA
jgi:site-specific DNA-methyltransferase (adenine-specific)